ncbi:unnamed protein product [Merluccius merluccius]
MAARLNGWMESETAVHLALALEGPALQTLEDLQLNYISIAAAQKQKFGLSTRMKRASHLAVKLRKEKETLGTNAADVCWPSGDTPWSHGQCRRISAGLHQGTLPCPPAGARPPRCTPDTTCSATSSGDA